jgi:malonyl-CoA O-methyltransferase
MDSAQASSGQPRPVDPIAAVRTRSRLENAAQVPWLHQEVARRMAELLSLIRRPPERVLDVWHPAGGALQALRQALPKASFEPPDAQPKSEISRMAWWRRLLTATSSTGTGGLKSAQHPSEQVFDLVWANMLLHHVVDPLASLRSWHRLLTVNGYLMFSTLGPGSLMGLRTLYAERGWGPAMADLVDMHDIGDMLVAAGFADPVMDQETLRLSWSSARAALDELRGFGGNLHPARHQGMRTAHWRDQLQAALEERAARHAGGRVVLELEVVYGHALKPPERFPVATETRIGLEVFRQGLGGARVVRSR